MNSSLKTKKERDKIFKDLSQNVKGINEKSKNQIAEEDAQGDGDRSRGALVKPMVEDDFENEEKDIKDILLVPSKYLLRFSSAANKVTVSDFKQYLEIQNRRFR